MSYQSSIEWTDATWNPVTGCTKVSPGCQHCYAEVFAERFRGVRGHPYEQGFDLRLWPERLELPLAWRKPRLIFVNSMSDLFHEDVPDEFVDSVFDTMISASWHTFQVLTKRPKRLRSYLISRRNQWGELSVVAPHIWLGTSIEAQSYVERARHLKGLPVSVRFLSCEPLLGPVRLGRLLNNNSGVNWVIVGGESGPRARPMKEEWATALRDQCIAADVPFFFKQWGGPNKKKTGRTLQGRTWDQLPVRKPTNSKAQRA